MAIRLAVFEQLLDEYRQFYNYIIYYLFEFEQLFPPENDEYSPKLIDKLIKVYRKMLTYFTRVFDKYKKPITAYAIFTDAGRGSRPNIFRQEFMGTSLQYTFNTVKISSHSIEALEASDNPFAMVVLIVKAALAGKKISNRKDRDELLFGLKMKLARQLLAKHIDKAKIRVLMNFLKYYVRFENSDLNGKFDEEVAILTQRSNTMGIEELLIDRATKQGEKKGIEKGLVKKSHDVVKNLLNKMVLSDEQVADLAEVSIEFVSKMRAELESYPN